jgi:hypothetical protein
VEERLGGRFAWLVALGAFVAFGAMLTAMRAVDSRVPDDWHIFARSMVTVAAAVVSVSAVMLASVLVARMLDRYSKTGSHPMAAPRRSTE